MRNVACAGGGQWEKAIRNDRGLRLRYETTSEPCRWRGERFPNDDWLPHGHISREACGICSEHDRRITRKPCPRCGGRVQLIEPELSP